MDEKTSSKDGAISIKKLEKNRNVRKSNPRGRPKGLPKTGGRKKSAVEDTSQWDEVLRLNSFNIPVEAIKLFTDKNTSNALKFSILQFLAQYTTAAIKPKENEDKSNPEGVTEPVSDILTLVGEK